MVAHKRKHRISPYIYALVWLVIFGWVLGLGIIAGTVRSIYLEHPEYLVPFTLDKSTVQSLILLLCVTIPYPFLFIPAAFEAYGKIVILDDCIELRALFRRRRRIYYSDIKYLGIDYRILNYTRQFWIYFRQDDFPPERNTRNPFRKYVFTQRIDRIDMRNVRVQFNQKVFDDLVYYLPPKLSKQLNSCYSIIRLYHEDDEEYDRYKTKEKKPKKKKHIKKKRK